MAHPEPGKPVPGEPAQGGAKPLAQHLVRARLSGAAHEVAAAETQLAAAIEPGDEHRWSRIATLGENARIAVRLGQASQCLAALGQQLAAAGNDRAALIWAHTSAAACRAVLGQVRRARTDLAEARGLCRSAPPMLAEPFWRFAEVVCDWLAGDWAAAQTGVAALDASRVGPVAPALAGTVAALRAELLHGTGRLPESWALASRLATAPPAEMSAWALAGLEADQGDYASALRRLADVWMPAKHSANGAALPLVLHRIAEIAYRSGDHAVAARAAAALAGLDQAAPLSEILAGLAHAYATGDPQPARRAESRALTEGAGMLAAEALTVRGRVGDDPATTLTAALSAWRRIGAGDRVRAVLDDIRAAGLAVPADGVPAVSGLAPEPAASAGAAGGFATGAPGSGPMGAAGSAATGAAGLRAADRAMPLTARERALARLVHEGRTNQQIAHALHISVKTVEACLTRVYRKTSCSCRVELAVAVTQRRIAADE